MRIAAKTDGNQNAIIETFRKAGASVLVLSAVGKGCPDLLVGWQGRNLLVEIKSKRGKFTPEQIKWWAEWHGQKQIIRSCLEAVELLNGKIWRSDLSDESDYLN